MTARVSPARIFVISVVVVWGLYVCFWNLGSQAVGDEENRFVVAGWQYVHGDFAAGIEQPPTAMYLFGLAQLVGGEGVLAPRALVGFLVVVVGAILFLWLRREVGWWAGVAAAALWLLTPRGEPSVIRIDRLALIEPVMTAFAICALYVAWQSVRSRRLWLAPVSGALMAISVTSGLAALLLLPAFLVMALMLRPRKAALYGALAWAAAFTVVAVALCLPLAAGWAISDAQGLITGRGAAASPILDAGDQPESWLSSSSVWFLWEGAGPILVSVLLLGLVCAVALRPGRLVLCAGVALGMLIGFGFASSAVLPHYFYAWIPFLVILAAIGYARLANLSPRRLTATVAVAAVLVAGVPAAQLSTAVWIARPPITAEPPSGVGDQPFSDGNGWYYTYIASQADVHEATTFESIEELVTSGYLQDRGVSNIMVYGPYASTEEWRGLPPTGDMMDFDPENGTPEEWRSMVETANAAGITVTVYLAPIYLDESSPLFIKAQEDRAEGLDTWESRLLAWESDGGTPPDDVGDWSYSDIADEEYGTTWGKPALNFAEESTMSFVKEIVGFWMDSGAHGIEIDSPWTAWALTDDLHTELIEYINGYHPESQVFTLAEGFGTPEHAAEMDAYGYSHIFLNEDTDEESVVTYAVEDGTADAIDALESHIVEFVDDRHAVGRGAIAANLYWTESWQQPLARLNLAVQGAAGALVSLDVQGVVEMLEQSDADALYDVFRALDASPALAPSASRERVASWPEDGSYAFWRLSEDGEHAVLCLFNFTDAPETVFADASSIGMVSGSAVDTVDVLTGRTGPVIEGGDIEIDLPAFGWAFLSFDAKLIAAPR